MKTELRPNTDNLKTHQVPEKTTETDKSSPDKTHRVNPQTDITAYTHQLSYSAQLKDYITRFKKRPSDIKHWPYGPYWPNELNSIVLDTPRHIYTCINHVEPLLHASELLSSLNTAFGRSLVQCTSMIPQGKIQIMSNIITLIITACVGCVHFWLHHFIFRIVVLCFKTV